MAVHPRNPWILAYALVGLIGLAFSAGARDGEGGAEEGQECSALPGKGMGDYMLKVAWAEGRTEAHAYEKAKGRAREQLVEQLCAGYDELRCAAVTRHVRDWGPGSWVPPKGGRPGSACAVVTIERTYMDQVESEYRVLDQDLTSLAGEIRDQLGAQPLVLDPPRWASGCNAGTVGAALVSELRRRLKDVDLAKPGRRPAGAQLLRLTISPGAESVGVDATLGGVRADVETSLGGLRFAPDLFGIPADEVGECASQASTGMADRTGRDGLRVDALFDAPDGLACEGSQVPMGLDTNRAARVWLFSVAPDGSALLAWPTPATAKTVEGHHSIGSVDVVTYPGGGDEQLVAVALPPDQGWLQVDSWVGPCRVPGKLSSLGTPGAAAVGSASYTVVAAGDGDCPETNTIDPLEMAAAIARLPVCGD